jgi:nitrogenase iron protein NifH
VTQAELSGKTTIEAAPDSVQARIYRDLAERVVSIAEGKVPEPLDERALRDWAAGWSHELLAAARVDSPVAVAV